MNKKRIVFLIPTVALSLCILFFVQLIVTPKYMSEEKYEGALTAEFYGSTMDHDVVFIGDCEVYESFVPAVIWDEVGVTSYVRGSPQQLIWQSYYMLEDIFRYEEPQAVVYNVLAMKYGQPQDEAYNRMTIDGMKWSFSKLDCIKASKTPDESVISYVFPILRFHSRWSELTSEDMEYMFSRDRISLDGYLPKTGISGKTQSDEEPPALLDPALPGICFEYLDKMKELCDSHGAKLILVKSPTDNWKYHWYDEWDKQISEYAEKNELEYCNLIKKCAEIGIDWSTDTYDAGIHLNIYGAEKTSRYFAEFLTGTCGISSSGEKDTAHWSENYADFCRITEEK